MSIFMSITINPIFGRIAALQILAIRVYVCGLRLALPPENRISGGAHWVALTSQALLSQ
jgi:hypothetical protein